MFKHGTVNTRVIQPPGLCIYWKYDASFLSPPRPHPLFLRPTPRNPPRGEWGELPTTRKSVPISVHVFFRVVADNADFFFPRCRPQHRKSIFVVAYNVEKWSALLATTRKNVRIRVSPRIRNHTRIYGYNQGPKPMCFMKKSWGEKSRGPVPLKEYLWIDTTGKKKAWKFLIP
jgi:hypothetical protein